MNPKLLALMKTKKKVPYTGPPRPTLLGHEKKMKEDRATVQELANTISQLTQRIDTAEAKIRYQTQIISNLTSVIGRK